MLVLNGREESKVHFARMWLDYLPNFQKLRRVAVVLLGKLFLQVLKPLDALPSSDCHAIFATSFLSIAILNQSLA